MNDFLQRLRERKLVQWALAYIAAAFALIQVLDIVAQRFVWPEQAIRFVIIALAIGFFVTLVLAWYHGERGAQRVTGTELLILALLLTIGGGAIWRLAPTATEQSASSGNVTATKSTSVADAPVDHKSIAVLPFENLSTDKDNAYFASGMQDEILTRLAGIHELKVISRTSTEQYASHPPNLKVVAEQLGVATVLEGSVQKAGDAVHINVQLIDAANDSHLWAQSYNRKLDDIFGVEGEVAQTVADTLKAKLTGSEAAQVIARPTSNPAAYDAYLRGLAFDNRTDSVAANVSKAIAAFEEAVRLDPGFAAAWARLSREHAHAYIGPDTSSAHRLAANDALRHAVSLAPATVETLLAQAVNRYWLERDYDGAKQIFERIRQQSPNDSRAIEWLAGIARRQDRWRESAALFDQAIELNPRDVPLLDDAISVALAMRDVRTAQRLLARVFDMTPDDPGALDGQVLLFQETGDIDRAQKTFAQARIAQGDAKLAIDFTYTATLNRSYEPAIALLTSQLEKPETLGPALGYFQVKLADLQRHTGNAVAAKHSYEQARATIETSLRAEPNNPYHINCLALAEAGLGNEASALEHAHRAVSLQPASKDAYVGPVWEENLARLQARFGDKDAAIAAIKHLLGTSYGFPPLTPALLRLDPDWDNLRSDPRFQKLIADSEVGMEAQAQP